MSSNPTIDSRRRDGEPALLRLIEDAQGKIVCERNDSCRLRRFVQYHARAIPEGRFLLGRSARLRDRHVVNGNSRLGQGVGYALEFLEERRS